MRSRLSLLLLLALSLALLLFGWLALNRRANAQFGEAVALCPGPDLYGYTCDGGAAFAYIDATNDTFLYADDGVTRIPLPFPFTFYGTTYERVHASSNGNLQFGANPSDRYGNACLADGVVLEMGDLIAPFWDDLDLTSYGYLETELVGEAPERIFVIEWDDIPIFGNEDERVTFAVQLFEADNSILFLYNDVTLLAGNNGASATIGIQSAAQELALQYSCFQPVVADASQIRFTHPARANTAVDGLATTTTTPSFPAPLLKGAPADLLEALNLYGRPALTEMQRVWQQAEPPRTAVWEWVDLQDGSGETLLVILRGPAGRPELTRLLLLQTAADGSYAVRLDQPLSRRDDLVPQVRLQDQGDLTGDGIQELLLHGTETGHAFIVKLEGESAMLHELPLRCTGSIGMVNGVVVGDDCVDAQGAAVSGRITFSWNGAAFSTNAP